MTSALRMALVTLLAGLAGPASAALFERDSRDLQAELHAAAAAGRTLAVLLTMPDCPSCLEMEKKVFHDPAIERAFTAKFGTVRVDITQESALIDPLGTPTTPSGWASRLHAVGTPSFVFLGRQGQVRYRYTGALDARGLGQLGQYVASGQYESLPFQPPHARLPHAAHH